mmetsp:Transcript_28060/g.83822  ORF Transcript_28060/g.83822 Transcript_28060/m.83822 type:complete len:105 (-) Transcript_28060:94-408(-)|eukprot:CAMPEP_0175704948 /NCGR_PEP_ID=MMETSP0097-20121207/37283_1 /TAXON_ID=311494 /ORGANISM="Alexandrium monilatum, Strain CCMP3105" /LENGTH=104 /DNA_ID=CAMNT_0017012259 /DNA_START=52 /DNA_END=366 /DNA_ORIENTATION=-
MSGSRSSSEGTMRRSASDGTLLRPAQAHQPSRLSQVGSACIYRSSNATYGSKLPAVLVGPKHGISQRFSNGVARAGMPRDTGLRTAMEKECRWMDRATDWQLRV